MNLKTSIISIISLFLINISLSYYFRNADKEDFFLIFLFVLFVNSMSMFCLTSNSILFDSNKPIRSICLFLIVFNIMLVPLITVSMKNSNQKKPLFIIVIGGINLLIDPLILMGMKPQPTIDYKKTFRQGYENRDVGNIEEDGNENFNNEVYYRNINDEEYGNTEANSGLNKFSKSDDIKEIEYKNQTKIEKNSKGKKLNQIAYNQGNTVNKYKKSEYDI